MKKIFISYSHKDVAFKELLLEQLRVLELEGFCDLWEDSRMQPGTDWQQEIETAINTAHIAILMISAGFLTSAFIRGKEVPPILQRRHKEGLMVLPLFVKPCAWKKISWLKKIQGFPSGEKSIMEMTKPAQLKQFTQFAESVHDLLSLPQTANTSLPTTGKTILLTPLPPRRIQLIGREKELATLRHMVATLPRTVLVHGLGGIGKTEVCKTFFFDHYTRYEYAAWVEWFGSLRESLVTALGADDSTFITAHETDMVDARFTKIMAQLRHTSGSLLLVLDNIENTGDADLLVLSTLPQNIKIVASSRGVIEGYEPLALDFLSQAECVCLFCRFYKGQAEENMVARVVERCGYHTLTVELLARTAYVGAMTVTTLVETLEAHGFNLNAVTGGKILSFWHDEGEKKTFFDHLVKVFDMTGVTEAELAVLVNVAVLPAVYIPMTWVKEWLGLKDMEQLNGLVERGWFKRDDKSCIYMHPVMQEVVRYKLKPNGKNCGVLIQSLTKILFLKPGDNPLAKKEFVPFGVAVVSGLEKEEKDTELAALANNLANIYRHMGQLERALEFQLKALNICEVVLDPNHPNLAASYNNVATIYQDMGQLERALEFQLKALNILEVVLDPNHPDLAQSYNNVATIYQDMGQLERALEFQSKALNIKEAVLDPNHPSLATSYHVGALIYRAMGQLERALEFQLKDLNICEAVLDPNHPHLATSYHNLSYIYQGLKNYETAHQYAQQAVTIWEKAFPDGHRHLDWARENLERLRKKQEERSRKREKGRGKLGG